MAACCLKYKLMCGFSDIRAMTKLGVMVGFAELCSDIYGSQLYSVFTLEKFCLFILCLREQRDLDDSKLYTLEKVTGESRESYTKVK